MNKEEYQLKQQVKRESKDREGQKRKIKKFIKITAIILILGSGIFSGGWYLVANITNNPTDDLSACIQHTRVGMHIHPHLSINISGEEYLIPSDIGISSYCMRPIHTHDINGTLHVEFSYQKEVKLGEFFQVWGKEFSHECIFEYCSVKSANLKMMVNGQENFDFENYIMKDGDIIEIIYGSN